MRALYPVMLLLAACATKGGEADDSGVSRASSSNASAGTPHRSSPADAAASCDGCDWTTQYCLIELGDECGDGGGPGICPASPQCYAIPAACIGNVTCACISSGGPCTEDGGQVTATSLP
jgi:hypothetical protein